MNLLKELTDKGYSKQADFLQKVEKNSIIIKTEKSCEEDFKLGESKIGGCPHLPEKFSWSKFHRKPLAFLAQVNLSQIAEYDTENLLPHDGILYFFHEGGEEVWGFAPKDKGGFKVIHYKGSEADLKVTALPESLEDYLKFSPCKVTFESKKSYPSDIYSLSGELFEDGNIPSDFSDIFYSYTENVVNKLLGYPDLIQGDIFLESQLVTNGLYCGDASGYNNRKAEKLKKGVSDWMLLFQIDSNDDADMMWSDVGRVYFTIKKDDLKKLKFDKIWSSFQCC